MIKTKTKKTRLKEKLKDKTDKDNTVQRVDLGELVYLL